MNNGTNDGEEIKKMYLEINENALKSVRNDGMKEAIENYGDDREDELVYGVNELDETTEIQEINGLTLSVLATGITIKDKKQLVYVSFDVTLDLDDVANILAEYVKRVNKIKTILEATK